MKTIEIPETLDEAMKILRTAWPAMRRTTSTAIIHSGGRRTIFGCLCGATHTCSTEWKGRDSKHVQDWQREHAACCVDLATKHVLGENVELRFGR